MISTYKYSIFLFFFSSCICLCDKQLAISLEPAFTRRRNLLRCNLPRQQHTKRAEIPADVCSTPLSSQSHILDSHPSKSPSQILFSTLSPCREFKRMRKLSSAESLSAWRTRQSCSDNREALSARQSLQFPSRQCKQPQVPSHVLPVICSHPEKKKKKDSFLKFKGGEDFLLMV